MTNKNTSVINLFAGPGAGKTTSSWQLAYELKTQGYVVEYVPEYAKELVWDETAGLLDGSIASQHEILKVQNHRLERLVGKVDFIVTDAPLLLNTVYLNQPDSKYAAFVFQLYESYDNINIFVQRDETYVTQGRLQTQEESRALDSQIRSLLEENGLPYLTCQRGHADELLPEIMAKKELDATEDREKREEGFEL